MTFHRPPLLDLWEDSTSTAGNFPTDITMNMTEQELDAEIKRLGKLKSKLFYDRRKAENAFFVGKCFKQSDKHGKTFIRITRMDKEGVLWGHKVSTGKGSDSLIIGDGDFIAYWANDMPIPGKIISEEKWMLEVNSIVQRALTKIIERI